MAKGAQLDLLRTQFVEYRLKVLSERMLQLAQKPLAQPVDGSDLAAFVQQQVAYLQQTYSEAFPQPASSASASPAVTRLVV